MKNFPEDMINTQQDVRGQLVDPFPAWKWNFLTEK